MELARNGVFLVETEARSTSQEQTAMFDGVLKGLSPLINSMRLFRLYFASKARVTGETTKEETRRRDTYHGWNFARVYATVLLIAAWLSIVRYAAFFDGTETLGVDLFKKLALMPGAVLTVILQTTYYVASHTGTLNRVLRQVNFYTTELSTPKYRRQAKVVTFICWFLFALNIFFYVYQSSADDCVDNHALLFRDRIQCKSCLYVVIVVVTVLQLQVVGTFFFPQAMKSVRCQVLISFDFPQAMNFMVMSFLCDQFDRLNQEFSKCIGKRGEFFDNFEQFRRRHQLFSRLVQDADRFLMSSNGSVVCCHVVTIILVFYSAIFYRHDTVALSPESTVLYITWLAFCVCGLLLAAGQAIILNHKASIISFVTITINVIL